MSTAERHLTLLVGLPGTGKTTFLAALYHVSEEADVAGAMRIELLSGDRTYLNDIRDRWLRCEEAQHTAAGKEEEVSLLFSDDRGGTFEVAVPDMSGESFIAFWEGRAWPESFDTRVQECAGVLLFLHPNELREGPTIDSVNLILKTMGGDSGGAVDGVQDADPLPEWDPATTPDQVKVVDVLQCISHRRGSCPPIAVVISAWDTQPADTKPDLWLSQRAPLLSQYLESHTEHAPFRVFGVSAQGGDIKDDYDRLIAETPSERIKVVGASVSDDHDVTAPLRWLLTATGGDDDH
jgi:hypothetical protein